jgi:uncharacterized membrane protein YesL
MNKLTEYLKSALIGLLVILIGFIISANLGSLFNGGNPQNSFLSGIVFAILFLCATIVICTRALIKAYKSK